MVVQRGLVSCPEQLESPLVYLNRAYWHAMVNGRAFDRDEVEARHRTEARNAVSRAFNITARGTSGHAKLANKEVGGSFINQ